jgi:hypothetical protein
MARGIINMRMLADLKRANANNMNNITDPYMLKPCLTSEGKPWTQRCFICGKIVNFLKLPQWARIRVGELVRHAKCKNYLYLGLDK